MATNLRTFSVMLVDGRFFSYRTLRRWYAYIITLYVPVKTSRRIVWIRGEWVRGISRWGRDPIKKLKRSSNDIRNVLDHLQNLVPFTGIVRIASQLNYAHFWIKIHMQQLWP
jgi:hypothetical protein